MKNIFLLLLILLTSCKSQTREMVIPQEGVMVEQGRIYPSPGVKRILGSEAEILQKLQLLVEWTLEKNYSKLPTIVHPDKGLYVDLKSLWEYSKLQEELKNPDSYLEVFFLNQEKMNSAKEGVNYTIRNLLILSKGITAEMYFETKDSCEIKLKFKENREKEHDLNNAYFIRVDGKWYLHRLF